MKENIAKQLAKISLIVLFAIFLASCENPLFVDITGLYLVKFETNGGTSIDSYRTNKIESMPQSSKTGHYLSAWHLYPNLTDTSVQFPFDVTGLTTLYAEWTPITYTVSFDSKKGSSVKSQTVDYGKTATKPENPTREKAEFLGWFTTDTYESAFDFASPILSDITLYAKWQVESRTIILNFNDENKIESKVVEYLSVLDIPPIPTKTGYTFAGWYTDINLGTLYDFSQPVTSNFSLYAKWVESTDTKYTIRHYKQNTAMNSYDLAIEEFGFGTTGSQTLAISKAFTGFTAKNFSQTTIAAEGSSMVEIYYDRNSYTVSFDSNGGSGTMSSETFYYEVPKELIENTFIPATGYEFSGWANSKDGSKVYEDKGIGRFTSDATLYAKWNTTSYTIYYELNGGTNASNNPANYTIKSPTITLATPTRKDCEFAGWYDNETFSGSQITSIPSGNYGNISLYAKWKILKFTAETIDVLDLSTLSDEYTLTITGDINENTILLLASKIEKATVDIHLDLSEATGVTEIKRFGSNGTYDSDFTNCTHLKSIVLPKSLNTLGDYAFWNCKYLQSITLPNNLTTIGNSVFAGCKNLKALTIPDSVTSFGYMTFSRCESLTEFTIPKGMTKIPSSAFSGCTSLTSIAIPSYVTSIKDTAFCGCTALKSVSIADSVKTIDFMAFYMCTSLESITIPASVTRIGSKCFYGCTKLTSITFSDTSTWYYTSSAGYRDGIQISVTTPTTNATYFTSTYVESYWYKE